MKWARKTATHKDGPFKTIDLRRSQGGAEPKLPKPPTVDVQEPRACGCSGEDLPLLSDIAIDEIEILAVTLLRFVFAGFCCGKVDCWNAGMDVAANMLGDENGGLFYSRALMFGRAVQRERHGNFNFMPVNCSRIAEDEIEVLELLKAVRHGESGPVELALMTLARSINTPHLSAAARSFGSLIASLANEDLPAADLSNCNRPVNPVLH